jgi:hypothetical protein
MKMLILGFGFFLASTVVSVSVASEQKAAEKQKGMWTCAQWVARCNPTGGYCHNPRALVRADCNHHGNT